MEAKATATMAYFMMAMDELLILIKIIDRRDEDRVAGCREVELWCDVSFPAAALSS